MAKAGVRIVPDRSGPTKAALVDAAIEALAEVGFAAASAREIAGRAGCNQALVFYHFGSVKELLLAALDEVSGRRFDAYRTLIDESEHMTDLVDSARTVFEADLAAGYVTVLVELICAAQSSTGLGEQVSARLAPWRELAATAVRRVTGESPLPLPAPVDDAAHALVAGMLGLELLAHLDGDHGKALALFAQARTLAAFVDMAGRS
jgi:AcrR family transcriptional regulator